MSKTTPITYLCKIRGFSTYKLEKSSSGYRYTTEVVSLVYSQYGVFEFLNPVYVRDLTLVETVNYEPMTDMFTISIPILSDPVVIQDFNAYEDKQIPLPIPTHTAPLTPYGIKASWVESLAKDSSYKPDTGLKGCSHEWVNYMGLNHSFEYCKKCDEKRNT